MKVNFLYNFGGNLKAPIYIMSFFSPQKLKFFDHKGNKAIFKAIISLN